MPKISSWMTRALLASFAMISLLASAAWAQQPPTVRIRGTFTYFNQLDATVKDTSRILEEAAESKDPLKIPRLSTSLLASAAWG